MKYLWIVLIVALMVGCEETYQQRVERFRQDHPYVNECGQRFDIKEAVNKLWEDNNKLRNKVNILEQQNELLRNVIKHPRGKCDICGGNIIHEYWLGSNGELKVITQKEKEGYIVEHDWGEFNRSGDWVGTADTIAPVELKKPIKICEECAKKDMGWLAKQYYERKK